MVNFSRAVVLFRPSTKKFSAMQLFGNTFRAKKAQIAPLIETIGFSQIHDSAVGAELNHVGKNVNPATLLRLFQRNYMPHIGSIPP